MRRALLIALLLGACVRSESVHCADDTICPPDTACATVMTTAGETETRCVLPAQLGTCGEESGLACAVGELAGTCHDGACFPNECGNHLLDSGEACDDANADPLDDCALDCTSTLACGNGIVDAIKGEQCDDGNRLGHDGCAPSCAVEQPRWEPFDEFVPRPRLSAGFAFDLERRRIVVFGGSDQDIPLGDTVEWDGQRWYAPRVIAPGPRTYHVMAYDAGRRVVVLFGGDAGLADTWEWNGATWRRRQPAISPASRVGAAMAYDARRRRIVLLGGFDERTGAYFDDHWEWDGETWQQLTVARPSPRSSASLAYDPHRAKLVMFGGNDTVGFATRYLGDTWELEPTGWRRVAEVGPSARSSGAMTFDPTNDQLMLSGGYDNSYLQDVWHWDGATWRPSMVGLPAPMAAHRAATDPFRRRVAVLGGTGNLIEWNGALWQLASERTPTVLSPRSYPISGYDPAGRRMIAFGGSSNNQLLADTWVWHDGWTRLPATPKDPAPRARATATYDVARAQLVMFGGSVGSTLLDETWIWKDGWSQATVPGPPVRASAAMAYDEARGQVVMFGGVANGVLGDTWIWDGASWRNPGVTGPPERMEAAMSYDPIRRRVVMMGGAQGRSKRLDDTWEWDGQSWREITARPDVPPSRAQAALAWNPARRRFVLFAGFVGFNSQLGNDVWESRRDNAGNLHWEAVATAESPSPRFGAMLVPEPSGGMLLFSGARGSSEQELDDAWRFVWDASADYELCTGYDGDHDDALGCADLDCWGVCTPLCPPLATACLDGVRCGDGTCTMGETCRTCAADCGICPVVCGDFACTDEATSCPGDCPGM